MVEVEKEKEEINMKVGITGHSSGIGAEFVKLLDKKHIPWVGFSLDNGYDIATEEGQRQIVNELSDCDVFFNNANDYGGRGSCQIDLLYKVWKIWKYKKTKIVCMSSLGGDYYKSKDEIPPLDEGKGVLGYDTYKAGLDYACKQLQMLPYWDLGYNCKVINIRPGLVDTTFTKEASKNYPEWEYLEKINPGRIAYIVLWIIQQPEHIASITIANGRL
jgi:hypothetical protein